MAVSMFLCRKAVGGRFSQAAISGWSILPENLPVFFRQVYPPESGGWMAA